jgi:hypothetical protein
LWPSVGDWPDAAELWPDVSIRPPEERVTDPVPVRASDVPVAPGPLWITYWAWAVTTPFIKIGRTQYEADRDGKWRGKRELAERRVRAWSTGCPWTLQLIRIQLDDGTHERTEHLLRESARVTPEREWFDLRRIEAPCGARSSR